MIPKFVHDPVPMFSSGVLGIELNFVRESLCGHPRDTIAITRAFLLSKLGRAPMSLFVNLLTKEDREALEAEHDTVRKTGKTRSAGLSMTFTDSESGNKLTMSTVKRRWLHAHEVVNLLSRLQQKRAKEEEALSAESGNLIPRAISNSHLLGGSSSSLPIRGSISHLTGSILLDDGTDVDVNQVRQNKPNRNGKNVSISPSSHLAPHEPLVVLGRSTDSILPLPGRFSTTDVMRSFAGMDADSVLDSIKEEARASVLRSSIVLQEKPPILLDSSLPLDPVEKVASLSPPRLDEGADTFGDLANFLGLPLSSPEVISVAEDAVDGLKPGAAPVSQQTVRSQDEEEANDGRNGSEKEDGAVQRENILSEKEKTDEDQKELDYPSSVAAPRSSADKVASLPSSPFLKVDILHAQDSETENWVLAPSHGLLNPFTLPPLPRSSRSAVLSASPVASSPPSARDATRKTNSNEVSAVQATLAKLNASLVVPQLGARVSEDPTSAADLPPAPLLIPQSSSQLVETSEPGIVSEMASGFFEGLKHAFSSEPGVQGLMAEMLDDASDKTFYSGDIHRSDDEMSLPDEYCPLHPATASSSPPPFSPGVLSEGVHSALPPQQPTEGVVETPTLPTVPTVTVTPSPPVTSLPSGPSTATVNQDASTARLNAATVPRNVRNEAVFSLNSCVLSPLLTQKGRSALRRVLWCLQASHPRLSFAPLIPVIGIVLLAHMDEAKAFSLLHLLVLDSEIVSRSVERALKSTRNSAITSSSTPSTISAASLAQSRLQADTMLHSLCGVEAGSAHTAEWKGWPRILTSREDFVRLVDLCVGVVERQQRELASHIRLLDISLRGWVCRLLVDGLARVLNFPSVIRVVTASLFEGPSVLLRYVVAYLRVCEPSILRASCAAEVSFILAGGGKSPACDPEELSRIAFSVPLEYVPFMYFKSIKSTAQEGLERVMAVEAKQTKRLQEEEEEAARRAEITRQEEARRLEGDGELLVNLTSLHSTTTPSNSQVSPVVSSIAGTLSRGAKLGRFFGLNGGSTTNQDGSDALSSHSNEGASDSDGQDEVHTADMDPRLVRSNGRGLHKHSIFMTLTPEGSLSLSRPALKGLLSEVIFNHEWVFIWNKLKDVYRDRSPLRVFNSNRDGMAVSSIHRAIAVASGSDGTETAASRAMLAAQLNAATTEKHRAMAQKMALADDDTPSLLLIRTVGGARFGFFFPFRFRVGRTFHRHPLEDAFAFCLSERPAAYRFNRHRGTQSRSTGASVSSGGSDFILSVSQDHICVGAGGPAFMVDGKLDWAVAKSSASFIGLQRPLTAFRPRRSMADRIDLHVRSKKVAAIQRRLRLAQSAVGFLPGASQQEHPSDVEARDDELESGCSSLGVCEGGISEEELELAPDASFESSKGDKAQIARRYWSNSAACLKEVTVGSETGASDALLIAAGLKDANKSSSQNEATSAVGAPAVDSELAAMLERRRKKLAEKETTGHRQAVRSQEYELQQRLKSQVLAPILEQSAQSIGMSSDSQATRSTWLASSKSESSSNVDALPMTHKVSVMADQEELRRRRALGLEDSSTNLGKGVVGGLGGGDAEDFRVACMELFLFEKPVSGLSSEMMAALAKSSK